jgi:anti-anti-sigma factor
VKIRIEHRDRVKIIHLKGESYVSTAVELRKSFQKELDNCEDPRFVLDLKEVEYFTSDEIGVVVELQKRLDERGGKLRICNVGDTLLELLRILRLDTILKIDETLEQSLASYSMES